MERLYHINEPAKLEKKLPLDLIGKNVKTFTTKNETNITYS